MSAVLGGTPAAAATPWRRALPAFGLALAALLVLLRDSFAAMVVIWQRSETFAHCFLVVPIVLWLVWKRRDHLARLAPRPVPWLLLPIAAVAFGWLVGDLAGVNALTQLAAVALLVLLVPATLGWAVARALAFPLAFLFFMVPFGEFLMPQLMQWTADFTVGALQLFGVPVYREGLQFIIPTGAWSVVEACSGVRYLLASFMVGTLFAYLNYQGLAKRLVFVAISLVVPVAANWLRAVMIVMLGHLSGNRIAAGVDHIIYGWLFFGLVIGLLYFIGARWADAPREPQLPVAGGAAPAGAWHWPVAAAAAALIALAPGLAWQFQNAPVKVPAFALPELAGAAAVAERPGFTPSFEGATAEASRLYREGADEFAVHAAYYRRQTYGHKLASSTNVLVPFDDEAWRQVAAGQTVLTVQGQPLAFGTALLHPGTMRAQGAAAPLQVRRIYWVDGRWTTSTGRAAIYALLGLFTGRGDDAAALIFTLRGEDAAALDAFAARHASALGDWLAAVRDDR